MAHGYHWAAVFGDPERFLQLLGDIIPQSRLVGSRAQTTTSCKQTFGVNTTIQGLAYADGPLQILSLTRTAEEPTKRKNAVLINAYPYLAQGNTACCRITSLRQDPQSAEGEITFEIPGFQQLTAFAADHWLNAAHYAPGQNATLRLAGLAYVLQKPHSTEIEVTEGPLIEIHRNQLLQENPDSDVSNIKPVKISLENLCYLLPRDESSTDYEFFGKPKSLATFQLFGHTIYDMQITLLRGVENHGDFDLRLLASEAALDGYTPKVGELVQGILWLNAVLDITSFAKKN